MRELNSIETEEVSGGLTGVFGIAGSYLGSSLGNLVDVAAGSFLGIKTDYSQSGAQLGQGIGDIFGLRPTSAINNIVTGSLNLVNTFFSSIFK